ncbi:MAG: ABC transporter ATP-binding protein [Desulfovibrio sp.]|jgi:heme exporter protein A|nr:ABC transporter ATP-binding protein [Desulfovibrio sp.]
MLLQLRDIARFYGSRLVFKGVSLGVRRQSVTLLAGANGAGKSTLLKIMAGLIRPSAGDILMDDGKEAVSVGFLGHMTFLYPELSAMENLRFWAKLHRLALPLSSFEDMLERVDLSAFAGEKAKSFSRGMAQRLNLARVFLPRPALLLLDEPGTGLDTRSTAILHREIASAKADGAGIVWITHSLEDDIARADTVALLADRRLAFSGSVEDYKRRRGALPTSAIEARPDDVNTRMAGGGEPC